MTAPLAVHGPWTVRWLPGSDLLDARCPCGARTTGTDPATVLDWLAEHPRGGTP